MINNLLAVAFGVNASYPPWHVVSTYIGFLPTSLRRTSARKPGMMCMKKFHHGHALLQRQQ